jgi:hypothetical protein
MNARNVQAVAGEGRAKLRRKSDFSRPKIKENAE